MGRTLGGIEGLLEQREQGSLLFIRRGPVARPGDLVEAEPGDPCGTGVLRQRVWVIAPLGDRESDALAGRTGELGRAELGAKARIAAQGGGGLREHADELGDGTASRLNALDQGGASIRGGELVVDVEATDVCLYGHFLVRRLQGAYFTFSRLLTPRKCNADLRDLLSDTTTAGPRM